MHKGNNFKSAPFLFALVAKVTFNTADLEQRDDDDPNGMFITRKFVIVRAIPQFRIAYIRE